MTLEDILAFERNAVWRYFQEALLPEWKNGAILTIARATGHDDMVSAQATARAIVNMETLLEDIKSEFQQDMEEWKKEKGEPTDEE